MKCPDCHGDGKSLGIFPIYHSSVHESQRKPFVQMNCERCGGSGEISDFMAAWMAQGRAMRDVRVKQGRTLRQEAGRLGIAAIDLSRRERGIVSP